MTGQYWDKTWNVVIGCDRVSSGCDDCFAIPTGRIREANPNPAVAVAFAGTVERRGGKLDWTGRVNMLADRLMQPLSWKKPVTIYVTLLGDLFHKNVTDEFIARVFAVILVAGRHTFLLTTKRHARMRALLNSPNWRGQVAGFVRQMLPDQTLAEFDALTMPFLMGEGAPNLRLAVSVEDQRTAELRIPALLDTPAAVHWISAEPLLGPIDLTMMGWAPEHKRGWPGVFNALTGEWWPAVGDSAEEYERRITDLPKLDWVVTGGESGHKARPAHPKWFRSLRDQCTDAGTPFWFKQHGEHLAVPVVDRPGMTNGRAYNYQGWHAVGIRERGPSGTYRNATTREMRVGESNKGGTLLDRDTFAMRLGVKKAGRELDGRTWDELPTHRMIIEGRR